MAEVLANLVLDLSQALAELDQLSADIDAATTDVSMTLDVESSVDEVQAELDSLSADAIEVPVEADVSDAEAEIRGLDADPVEIPVEADTSQAQESIDALGDTAAESAGGFDALSGAAGSFGGVAGAATGDVSGLTGALGSFGPQAAGAAAAGAVLAGTFDTFASAGLEAIGVEQRFQNATGELGAEIRSIDVGGLNTDLGELAISLGGSDEAALAAATNLALIGEQAGATDSEINTFTDGLFAFEAAALASGLASGSLGDNTQRLASGFARGGRFLQNFGVSLTSAEIAQQALLETGKSSAAQLTQFEKAQAGVNLALAQNPDLAAQVAAGQQNIQTQLAATKARFGEVIEELGRPMAPQLVEVTEAATLLATEGAPAFAEVSGAAAEMTITVLELGGALADLESVSTGIFDALGVDALEVAQGGLDELLAAINGGGENLGKSAASVGEGGAAAAAGLSEMEEAASSAAAALPSLGDSFSDVSGKADGLAEEFGILNAESNPAILAANLQAQADAINQFTSNLTTIAGEGFGEVAATLQAQGPEVASGYASALATALEAGDLTLAASLANAISNFEDASVRAGAAGSEFGGEFSGQAQGAITSGGAAVAGAASTAGNEAATGISSGFAIAVALMQGQMTVVEVTVATAGVSLAATSRTVGYTAGASLGQGFLQGAPALVGIAMQTVGFQITSSGISLQSQARSSGYGIGLALGQGIQSGIGTTVGAIASAAASAVREAEAAARSAAQTGSPSKLFMRVGEDMGEGLALGFAESARALIGEAEGVTMSAAGAAGGTNVGGVNIHVEQTVNGDPGDHRTIRQASRRGVEEGARELARIAFDTRGA